jgi:hypothetical protein
MKPTTTNNPNNRNSFIFYRSFFETIGDLNDADQLQIYRAIAEYSLNDKLVDLTGFSKTIFRLIEPQLLANKRRFENGLKGAEHGAKGGRPKSKKTPKKPLKNPKLTPNKNKNVNLNEELESKLKIINVNLETWQDFVSFREQIKKPLSEKAEALILKKLSEFETKQNGFANKSLENSIENSWQGVFEPKLNHSSSFTKPAIIQDSFCQSLNQALGQPLVKNLIEGDIITIKLSSASANDKWDALNQELRESVIAKVKTKFGKNIKISF